jgi:predicted dehydrogenase
MSRRLKLGIIGCGGISAFAHVPALCAREDIEITFLCDRNIRRAETIKERFSLDDTLCVADHRDFLRGDFVQGVVVATWPSQHAEIAIEAITRGLNVLIQKPLLASAAHADLLHEAVSNSDKNILALPLIEAIPSFAKLGSLVKTGELGAITFARIRTTVPEPDEYYADVREFFHESGELDPPYRKLAYAGGAGSAADMGPYALSAFYFLFGKGKLRSVNCWPVSYDNCAVFVMEIDSAEGSRALCSVETGWGQVRSREVCTVFGSLGTACIESSGDLVVERGKPYKRIIDTAPTNRSPLPLAPIDAQNRWIEAIRTGCKAKFHNTVESAAWVSRILADVGKLQTTHGKVPE